MSKNPPILIASGSEDLLRQRFIRDIVTAKEAEGWETDKVDGLEEGAVRDALDGSGLFSTRMSLVVVSNPHKVDLDLLKAHAEVKKPETVLLLEVDGSPNARTKFGKWVKGDMSKHHRGFPKPKEWEAPKYAADFVEEEARRHGKSISPALAGALVKRVGTDLGMLSFEVLKLDLLMDEDEKVIEAKHVKGTMAQIAEASLGPILDALSSRNEKELSKALARLRATTKSDPTIRVARFLGASVVKWMQVAHLDSLPPSVAARELGLNPWYFENKVLPVAKRWGKSGTLRLVSDLATAERAVLRGAIDPWSILTVLLLTNCR